MKKALLLGLALLLVSSAAHAQYGYIALFTDDARTAWCVTGTGFYPADVWIWCLPGVNGQICAEFAIGYPSNVIGSTVTWNEPLISVFLGDLPNGLSVCFVDCQHDWFWIVHMALWVTDPIPAYIEILPHPGAGVYQFANCLEGYPVEPCTKLTNFYVNYGPEEPECGVLGVEDTSWGAIKSIFE